MNAAPQHTPPHTLIYSHTLRGSISQQTPLHRNQATLNMWHWTDSPGSSIDNLLEELLFNWLLFCWRLCVGGGVMYRYHISLLYPVQFNCWFAAAAASTAGTPPGLEPGAGLMPTYTKLAQSKVVFLTRGLYPLGCGGMRQWVTRVKTILVVPALARSHLHWRGMIVVKKRRAQLWGL